MNVANRNLCQELYELSGWSEAEFWYAETVGEAPGNWTIGNNRLVIGMTGGQQLPAYELGEVLRKLPEKIYANDRYYYLTVARHSEGSWYAAYGGKNMLYLKREKNDPEDALCKLAIELFKQGILTKEASIDESRD
jgi:hypothetical protein